MEKKYNLPVLFLSCLLVLTTWSLSACKPGETHPPVVEVISSVPSATLPQVTETPPPATPTVTSEPSLTPTFTPIPATDTPVPPTPIPFLPSSLVKLNPENISGLQLVADLPQPRASVVVFSPDSSLVAAGFSTTGEINVWELTGGTEVASLSGHTGTRIISYLAFSPDGLRLASGAQGWEAADDSLILWDVATGQELDRFDGVLGAVSPDWRLAALTEREREEETKVTLVDLESGEVVHTLDAPSDIYGIVFSADGTQVAAKMLDVWQDLFSFWSVDSGLLNRTLYNWVGFSCSPNGMYTAALVDTGSGSEKGELNVFDANTFKWKKTVAKEADSYWYTYPVFSQDGQFLAASLGDHIAIWDTATWEKRVSLPASGPTGATFSPDGRILATFSLSGPVQLWGVTANP